MFFDDILVYSKSWPEHLTHLRIVLTILRNNTLYAKESKCSFKGDKVEYLGHFVSKNGVLTDLEKIVTVSQWLIPKSVKQLRGFLGLAG